MPSATMRAFGARSTFVEEHDRGERDRRRAARSERTASTSAGRPGRDHLRVSRSEHAGSSRESCSGAIGAVLDAAPTSSSPSRCHVTCVGDAGGGGGGSSRTERKSSDDKRGAEYTSYQPDVPFFSRLASRSRVLHHARANDERRVARFGEAAQTAAG